MVTINSRGIVDGHSGFYGLSNTPAIFLYLVKVDKWFPSSQICHCCGSIHPEMKDLAIRTMACKKVIFAY